MGGIRILEGEYDGHRAMAVMIDDTHGRSFGPTFDDAESVEEFMSWCEIFRGVRDVRDLSQHALDGYHAEWVTWRQVDDHSLDAFTSDELFEFDLLDVRDQMIVRHEALAGRAREALAEFVR